MSRFGLLAILFCLVIILGAGFGDSAIAQTCAHKDSIKCEVDDVPYTGDEHDACSGLWYMNWKMIVDVASVVPRNAILRFKVLDGNNYRWVDVDSGELQPGVRTVTAGPFTLNRLNDLSLNISWQQTGQGFQNDVIFVVNYLASKPD